MTRFRRTRASNPPLSILYNVCASCNDSGWRVVTHLFWWVPVECLGWTIPCDACARSNHSNHMAFGPLMDKF